MRYSISDNFDEGNNRSTNSVPPETKPNYSKLNISRSYNWLPLGVLKFLDTIHYCFYFIIVPAIK